MKHTYFSRIGIFAALLVAPLGAAAQTITGFSPTFAQIGQTFTISGTGLATTTAVTINGETMPFTYSAISQALTVTVPRQASSGIVRVTTSSGTAITGKAFRVTRVSTSFSFPAAASAVTGAGTTGDFSTPCLADLDDDGLLDMIVGFGIFNNTSGTAGTLQRYEQATATDGNFTSNATTSPRTLTVGAAATAGTPAVPGNPAITVTNFAKPYITDLDGDGLLDMLIGENDGRVYRYEQNSVTNPNNFDAAVLLFANPEGVAATTRLYCRPTVVDLNGNGLLDVLVGGNDGRIRRYEQNAANATTTAGFTDFGYLQDVTGTAAPLDGGDVSKAQVLDIDGDGLLDLLVGNAAGNLIQYTQSAVGAVTFVRPTTNSFAGIALGATQYAAPVMADIDGDGLLDLMLGNFNVGANVAGSTNAVGANALRYEQANNSTPTPLPVVLKAFSGQATSEGALLRWSTAQELNSDKFVVERSADGKTFREVAQVRAAGNSTAARSYQYEDASAEARSLTTSYYRLQQQDLDGTVTVSPVVVVSRLGSTQVAGTASPNPFSQELYVALPAGTEPQPTQVTLTTLTGATVYSAKLPLSVSPQLLPALPELKSGLYLLQLTTATKSITQRVVRQ